MNILYMSNNAVKGQQISGLNGLRALAITGVTLFHMFPNEVPGGYFGVSLFFVLTGFLLAYTSRRQLENGKFSIISYYWKRIKRIYPSMIIMLLTTIGVCNLIAPDIISAVRPEVTSIVLGYNNLWQIEQNADYFTRLINTSPFTHMWFMGIELQYYLAWPVVFGLYAVLHKFIGKAVGIGFIALVAIGAAAVMPIMYQPDMDITRLYYGTDTRVYALLFGALMGLCYSGNKQKEATDKLYMCLQYGSFTLLLAATVAVFLMWDGQNPLVYKGGMLVMTVAFCLLLGLATEKKSSLGRHLDNPVCSWIGKRSYGIFLWQYPVIYLFSHMGWDKMPLCYGIELLVILALTVWSDAMSNWITRFEIPYGETAYAAVSCVLFFATTVLGTVVMSYGCQGIIASASDKAAVQSELKSMLEANAAHLKNQTLPNTAVNEEQKPAEQVEKVVKDVDLSGAVCIGDSVMLGSAPAIQNVLPGCYIDAAVSRYVSGGAEVAYALLGQGNVGNLVVISLGTNGPLDGAERYSEMTYGLVEALGPERQIFWVNIYGPELSWQDSNNQCIAKLAADHKNIHVVDWYSVAAQHPEWLTGDGIHPGEEGAKQYAKLIHDKMVEVLSTM